MRTYIKMIAVVLALVVGTSLYAGTLKVFNDGGSTASETSGFGVVGNKSVDIGVYNDGGSTASATFSTGFVSADVLQVKTVTATPATDTLVVGNLYINFNTTNNKFSLMYKEASGSVFLAEVAATEQ